MLNIGNLVVKKALDQSYILGTVIDIHDIYDTKFAKIMWITNPSYPVTYDDFYHDYANINTVNNIVFVLNDISDIPNSFLPPN